MRRFTPKLLYDRRGNLRADVARRIRRATSLALYLDYDGTLTPIRPRPQDAVLSSKASSILNALLGQPHLEVAIVTGRSLSGLRSVIRPAPKVLVANHGLEIERSGKLWIHPAARRTVPVMRTLRRELAKKLKGISGVAIEDKHVIVTVHYRNVPSRVVPCVRSIVHLTASAYAPFVRITRGKKVIECRPAVHWSKGSAVLRLAALHRNPARLPIYIGDDLTDEDAFRALRRRGITVRVGLKDNTAAEYALPNVPAVLRFLRQIPEEFRTSIHSRP